MNMQAATKADEIVASFQVALPTAETRIFPEAIIRR
jgi:hypothetical protein